MGLTNKQQAFINAYLHSFNATKAAIEAGYSEDTAYSQGSRLLKNVEISDAIRARLQEAAMSADEVLFHLREIAIGLRDDVTDSDGRLDPQKIKEAGQTHLVKFFRQRSITTEQSDMFESELEPYDRVRALELLGKHHKLFTDKTELTGKDGEPLEMKAYVSFSPDDWDDTPGS